MDYIVYRHYKGTLLGWEGIAYMAKLQEREKNPKAFDEKELEGMKTGVYMNLNRGTLCTETNGLICLKADNTPLVFNHSENAYQYFARNDDGRGLQRGDMTTEIKKLLRYELPVDFNEMRKHWQDKARKGEDKVYDERWKKIWTDATASKYRRKDHKDFWVWDYTFYNAPISDLEYMIQILTDVKEIKL